MDFEEMAMRERRDLMANSELGEVVVELEHCSHCSIPLEGLFSKTTFVYSHHRNYKDNRSEEVPVWKALSNMFEESWGEDEEGGGGEVEGDKEEGSLFGPGRGEGGHDHRHHQNGNSKKNYCRVLCFNCGEAFSLLYNSFQEFVGMSVKGSRIAENVRMLRRRGRSGFEKLPEGGGGGGGDGVGHHEKLRGTEKVGAVSDLRNEVEPPPDNTNLMTMEDSRLGHVGGSRGADTSVQSSVSEPPPPPASIENKESSTSTTVTPSLEEKAYSCTVCSKVFLRMDSIRAHVRVSHLGFFFDCALCSKKYERVATLKAHFLTDHGRAIKPEETPKHPQMPTGSLAKFVREIPKPSTLQSARLKTTDPETELIHKCSECGRRFAQLDSLQTHKLYHHNKQVNFDANCPFCDRNIKRYDRLPGHLLSVHNLLVTPTKEIVPSHHACSVCTELVFREELESHMKELHGVSSPFSCTACNKAEFSSWREFLRHQKSRHPEVGALPCESCGAEWSLEELEQHERCCKSKVDKIKDVFPPFTCDDCGAVYRGKLRLLAHQWKKHGKGQPVAATATFKKQPGNPLKKTRGGGAGGIEGGASKRIWCAVCKLSFCGQLSHNAHLKFMMHRDNLRKCRESSR